MCVHTDLFEPVKIPPLHQDFESYLGQLQVTTCENSTYAAPHIHMRPMSFVLDFLILEMIRDWINIRLLRYILVYTIRNNTSCSMYVSNNPPTTVHYTKLPVWG